MDLIEFKNNYEDRHPWETARYGFFSQMLKSEVGRGKSLALDIGAGDAWFASTLKKQVSSPLAITCWDVGYDEPTIEKISALISPSLKLTNKQPKETFDLIWALDVLEHIGDDKNFLGAVVEQNLNLDGTILISVPAWQTLFSDHDIKLKHFRRYSPLSAKKLIKACGLKIERCGCLFSSLLVLRAFEKIATQLKIKTTTQTLEDNKNQRNSLIENVLNVDAKTSKILSTFGIDFLGLSWWALCRLK